MIQLVNKKNNRKLHKWLAIIIGIPIILIILTGIFLQVRKPIDWIQPTLIDGSAKYDPSITLEEVLTSVKSVPAMNTNGWDDIKLLDIRPKNGTIKVRNRKELETQVDAKNGTVLQTKQRLNDIVNNFHEGNNRFTRLAIYLPIKLGFLFIFVTGIYLNVQTIFRKKKKASNIDAQDANQPTDKRPFRIKLRAFLLKYHAWLGWVVIIPWTFVISSGLLLQVRHEVPWLMPVQQTGKGMIPQVEIVDLFEKAKQYPQYGVEEWEDVWRIYVYPDKGISTIRAKNRNEFQFDSETGELLQVQYRRTDILEDIHEGKLGSIGLADMNLWLFLPIHILSIFLWLTGFIVVLR